MTELPDGPWEKVSMDFAGPLPNKDTILVMWDQYAKYPVVEFVTTTSAETTIRALERIFTTYGTPKEIKTDNGPPFNSGKFSEFAKTLGFKHRKVTPKWAEANGDVERMIQIIKKSAKIAKIEGKNIRQEIQKTIRSYRDTPHGNTGETPNKLIFGRELNGRLPPRMAKKTVSDATIRQRDATAKQKCKAYADSRRHTKAIHIEVGDKILVEQDKIDSLTPRYNPEPFVVIARKGSMITAQKGETILCRNTAKCKRLKCAEDEESDNEWQPSLSRQMQPDREEREPTRQRSPRPMRNRISTKQTIYKDFHT
ncbi:uncharacterized protein K02A2.6-like [Dendronephthya gigantea]|uniref:uncharacterized protein K02A2.6-like n=1 Tax=Dendronephthya gigantea TaxID=151771 RepID=UPI00106D9CFF|nr:uncharacterized protein K02A2.6-like [Dendronephthya gigantea]